MPGNGKTILLRLQHAYDGLSIKQKCIKQPPQEKTCVGLLNYILRN